MRTLLIIVTLLVALPACSGSRGAKSSPRTPESKACAAPDAGSTDQSAKNYYQIGTCPVDENEGAEVIIDE